MFRHPDPDAVVVDDEAETVSRHSSPTSLQMQARNGHSVGHSDAGSQRVSTLSVVAAAKPPVRSSERVDVIGRKCTVFCRIVKFQWTWCPNFYHFTSHLCLSNTTILRSKLIGIPLFRIGIFRF